MPLILASASIGRKSLLEQAGMEVVICPSQVTELTSHPDGSAALVLANARLKAEAVHRTLPPNDLSIVLSADTLVCIREKIFGKPKDRADAENMLTQLCGHWHEVITGVCLRSSLQNTEFCETTRVLFHPLKLEEIRAYLDTIHPYDKAGSYSAQEGGERIIAQVKGSFSNIVGLPIEALQNTLSKFFPVLVKTAPLAEGDDQLPHHPIHDDRNSE